MTSGNTGKPTLRQVREAYNERSGKQLTSLHIAERAQIPLADEWAVEIGGAASEALVYKVLRAWRGLTGHYLGIADISVTLKAQSGPTLGNLCNKHGIAALSLAQESGRSMTAVWEMATGSVSRETATSLLASFNRLAHTDYSLDELRVNFNKEGL